MALLNWFCWLRGVCVVGTVSVVGGGGVWSVSLGMPVVFSPVVIDIGMVSFGRWCSVVCVCSWKLLCE